MPSGVDSGPLVHGYELASVMCVTGSPVSRQETAVKPGPHRSVTGTELPLPDLPLVVEDLLVKAKRLVDAGAPTAVVAEILDQVAALRDGLDS